MDNVRSDWLRSVDVPVFRSLAHIRRRLGTDCSGAEAPVWAMTAMQIPHDHIFSCDDDKQVQEFIRSVSPPSTRLFTNMLKRPLAQIPDVDVYVCGFPCTPYSTLRAHRTKLFKEAAAKPYFELLRVLQGKRPALAILENVAGLCRLKDKVLRDLVGLKWYYVLWMMIDSEGFGEPVSRPRCYFLLLRRDACVSSDVEKMAEFCKRCLAATHALVREHVLHRMLPNHHIEVRAHMQAMAQRQPGRLGAKWLEKHAEFRQAAGVSVFRGGTCSMPLTSPRQQEAWRLLQHTKGQDIIADLSQAIDRGTCRTNGVCPTITPRGICCVGALGRPVLPCEKLLLHGFPLHRMKIPRGISDHTLGRMGGNTMHLHSIGLALLMGLSLLRDPLPGAPPSECPTHVVKPVFVRVAADKANRAVGAPPGKRPRV